MKKQIILATLLYTLSTLIILGLVINFLGNGSYITITLFVTTISLIFGYILNSYILGQKFNMDENLLHLTKEILHELNIPLSTIQANSLLLKRSLTDNEKAIKRLNRIENSSNRLLRLYNELIYSIKKEIHTIEKERFELTNLIEERVNELRLLNRNPFELKVEPHTVIVDKIGFEKMLDNVLTNAMKYSQKEEVITIKLQNSILIVEDRGIGMDETELISIYERYYQSDNFVYGEGIGLALVKAYCDDEKIKIWISSQKGLGTKVSFDLSNVID
ncbi:MAG TPA: HAMP domain-containing histidine kinase [Campylobacterales bacterium]|nr:HAMP domain-containing histidine kinase [Campylobacterales bacterium]